MARCLRCKAGAEWIEGDPPKESGWKEWHRELADILGCEVVERSVTLEAIQALSTRLKAAEDKAHRAEVAAELAERARLIAANKNDDLRTKLKAAEEERDNYLAALRSAEKHADEQDTIYGACDPQHEWVAALVAERDAMAKDLASAEEERDKVAVYLRELQGELTRSLVRGRKMEFERDEARAVADEASKNLAMDSLDRAEMLAGRDRIEALCTQLSKAEAVVEAARSKADPDCPCCPAIIDDEHPPSCPYPNYNFTKEGG